MKTLKLLKHLILGILFCYSINSFSQNCTYKIVSYHIGKDKNTAVIKLDIELKNKKLLEQETVNTALNIIMFEGLPGTKFSKPLVSEGRKTTISKYPEYFKTLFEERREDFVTGLKMLSNLQKRPNNMTEMEITVNVLKLRKDLEKNKIIKHMSL